MAEKETIMILRVDNLKCPKCYQKVEKLLRQFNQIRNPVFDNSKNTVTITVVDANPEKFRDMLCSKGRGAIKSIEIVEPRPSKEEPPSPPKQELPSPPKQEPPPLVLVCHCPPPVRHCPPPPVCHCPPRPGPPPIAVPVGVCCESCYEGRPGGPCFRGHSGPPPCYGAYYGRPVYDSYGYGGGRPCYVSRCDEYFCEENTSACTIM